MTHSAETEAPGYVKGAAKRELMDAVKAIRTEGKRWDDYCQSRHSRNPDPAPIPDRDKGIGTAQFMAFTPTKGYGRWPLARFREALKG